MSYSHVVFVLESFVLAAAHASDLEERNVPSSRGVRARMSMTISFIGSAGEQRDSAFIGEFSENLEPIWMNVWQSSRYWSAENHCWLIGKNVEILRVVVCAGILIKRTVEPYPFPGTVTGQSYLKMSKIQFLPELEAFHMAKNVSRFMHDGAPACPFLSRSQRMAEWRLSQQLDGSLPGPRHLWFFHVGFCKIKRLSGHDPKYW